MAEIISTLERHIPSLKGALTLLSSPLPQQRGGKSKGNQIPLMLTLPPSDRVTVKLLQAVLEDLDYNFEIHSLKPEAVPTQAADESRLLEAGKAFCHLGLADDAETQLREAVEKNPGCAEAYHYLAAVLKRRNQTKQALQLTRRGLDANIDDPSFRYLMGDLCADCDQPEEAITHLKEAIRLQPDSPNPYARLGEVFQQTGQTDSACLAFEEALTRDPNQIDALAGLGSIFVEQGRLGNAIDHLEQALRQDPKRSDCRLKLGWCLLHSNRPHQAEVEFLRVGNEEGQYRIPARFSLGRLYASQDHHSLAVELLEDVCREQPDLGEAHLLLAQSKGELGADDEALVHYHEALRLSPDREGEINPQLALCLSRLQEHDLAIQLAQEALLQQGPLPSLLELLASIYMAAEEWEEALTSLQEAEKQDPESAHLAFQLGWVHENLDQAETAEAFYSKSIRLDPAMAEAFVGLGWLYYERQQMEVALILFEKAQELEPAQAEMADQVGWVLLLMGRYSESLNRFQEAVRLDPLNPFYRCHRAAALYHLERFDEAEQEIQQTLTLDPDEYIEAFCHYILGLTLEALGQENTFEEEMESSIELLPPEFVAITSDKRLRSSPQTWKQYRVNQEGEKPARQKRQSK